LLTDFFPCWLNAVVLGHEQLPGRMVDEMLLRFGRRLSSARKKYREFAAAGEGRGVVRSWWAEDCAEVARLPDMKKEALLMIAFWEAGRL
jgi:hypothetical protein